MSPIFNHHALNRLSTRDLNLLRETLRRCFSQENLSEADRINLHAALARIDAALSARSTSTPPAPRPRF